MEGDDMEDPKLKEKINQLNTVQVTAEFNIRAYSNGTVNITGPIDNFFLFRSVMNSAEQAVLDHIAKKSIQQKSNIIVPGMVMPKGATGRN